MARKKESAFGMLVEFVTVFPWWVGIALAIISYFSLQPYIHTEIAPAKNAVDVGVMVHSQLTKTFATLGQYLLPAICLLGAAISFFKRKKRELLFEQSAKAHSAALLNDPSWQEFEMLVGD